MMMSKISSHLRAQAGPLLITKVLAHHGHLTSFFCLLLDFAVSKYSMKLLAFLLITFKSLCIKNAPFIKNDSSLQTMKGHA